MITSALGLPVTASGGSPDPRTRSLVTPIRSVPYPPPLIQSAGFLHLCDYCPMSVRVKVGPVNVSSTGRVGVKAGPVYVSGGGRRRRRSSRSSGDGGTLLFALIAIAVAIAIIIFIVMWPLSLWGHAIHLTPSWHQLMHRDHIWMHEHYPLVGLRYLGAFFLLVAVLGAGATPLVLQTNKQKAEQQLLAAEQTAERDRQAHEMEAQQEREAHQLAAEQARDAQLTHERWLAGPPPLLAMPGRFTQSWITHNVPSLHPGQIPLLMDELRRRGWSDSDIEQRVAPYLPGTPIHARVDVDPPH